MLVATSRHRLQSTKRPTDPNLGLYMNRQIIPMLVTLAVLQGCSTMSKDECLVSSWYDIGYVDGTRGAPPDTIAKHRKACAEHGVAADFQAYNDGRLEGLRYYCRPQRGYELGTGGAKYQGVCPSELEGGFLRGYRAGRELYDLQAQVRQTNRQLARKRRESKELETALTDKGTSLIGNKMSTQDKVRVIVETQQIYKRLGRLETEILHLERAKARHEAELVHYKDTSPNEFFN